MTETSYAKLLHERARVRGDELRRFAVSGAGTGELKTKERGERRRRLSRSFRKRPGL
jgi:hypothetical protein